MRLPTATVYYRTRQRSCNSGRHLDTETDIKSRDGTKKKDKRKLTDRRALVRGESLWFVAGQRVEVQVQVDDVIDELLSRVAVA